MAETPCILGQVFPDAKTDIDLFKVPPNSQVQCTIFVANTEDTLEQVSIALIPEGSVPGTYNYIAYNTPLTANACIAFAGIFLKQGDIVRVTSFNGHASFSGTGMLMS